jgi:tetratricopeptide (TPR) repeat protein
MQPAPRPRHYGASRCSLEASRCATVPGAQIQVGKAEGKDGCMGELIYLMMAIVGGLHGLWMGTRCAARLERQKQVREFLRRARLCLDRSDFTGAGSEIKCSLYCGAEGSELEGIRDQLEEVILSFGPDRVSRDLCSVYERVVNALNTSPEKKSTTIGALNLNTAPSAGAEPKGRVAENLDPIMQFLMAETLHQSRELEQASQAYRKLIALKPDQPAPHRRLADLLMLLGERDQGIGEYRAAIRLKPQDAFNHHSLGKLLYIQGDKAGAIAEYREALRLKSGDPGAHSGLGSVLFDNGDSDGAIAECQEALRLDPDDYGAHVVLGAAFGEKGDEEAALGHFREADRLNEEEKST